MDTIQRCIEIVRSEEELDGPMPPEIIDAFRTIGPEEACRMIVRATKTSIVRRLSVLAASQ